MEVGEASHRLVGILDSLKMEVQEEAASEECSQWLQGMVTT